MYPLAYRRHLLAASLLGLFASSALAADGYKVRFPLSGTLGGEIVAPLDRSGVFGSIAVTQIEIDKVTDGTGNARQQPIAGTFSIPTLNGPVSASYSGTVGLDVRQSQTQANLTLGYLSEEQYQGGRLSFVFNLPYVTRLDRTTTISGQTPTLTAISPLPAVPPAMQAGFATAYQAGLSTQSAAASGVVDGIGDAEVTAAWVYRQDKLKLLTGLTVVLPTGDYDKDSALNIGFGNFYTVRPGAAVVYSPSEKWTLGARGSLAFNTRNKDNQIKSGDFAALDLAAAYRSSIGVFGPHVTMVRQFSDDNGGTQGANRFSATGAGVFFTTLIPGLNAAVNLSYMNMIKARNSLSGSFYQVRVSKAF
jgi:hypothetical protein